MANLYHDTAEPAAPTPALAADCEADVLVIGAGFTGLSTALHLAERGAAVVLLEAESVGWGASGRNGGQINPGLKPDPDVVERDHGLELGARMNAFAGAAPDVVFDLVQRFAIRCDARRNGTLRAALHAADVRAVRHSAEQLARRGAPVELLVGQSLARAVGTNRYACAMLDRRGGDLNPLSFARGLARAALAAGVRLHGGTRVLSLHRVAGRWQARSAAAKVSAAQVVLATNGYTDGLWPGLQQSIVPVFGAIAASEPLPPAVARAILPERSVLYESGAITVYYRIDATQRLLFGGRGPMRDVSDTAAIRHLLRYAAVLWPALGQIRWTHAWGGRLAMTTDHYPHWHEPAEGLCACVGYNGRGVAMGCAMGMLLARRLLQPTAPLQMPITPIRTIPLHGLWRWGVRAAIARGRIRDGLNGAFSYWNRTDAGGAGR